jgi:hypothetical protein
MDTLPAELILNIVSCKSCFPPSTQRQLDAASLPPPTPRPAVSSLELTSFLQPVLAEEKAWKDIVHLQAVSKRFLRIGRDNELWRQFCYDHSYSESLWRGKDWATVFALEVTRRAAELTQSFAQNSPQGTLQNGREKGLVKSDVGGRVAKTERTRALANWDPSYEGERIDWYGEYIARHAPISMNWLQQPRLNERDLVGKPETKGMGLYNDSSGSKVVGLIDDGSVCLWTLDSDHTPTTTTPLGSIFTRSKTGLVSADGSKSKAKSTSTGVVECVSIDTFQSKAYIAVQNGLNEVDLNTLQVSHLERFPFTISALSEARYPTPLTVGTALSLHLHDPRRSNNACWAEDNCEDRIDTVASFPTSPHLQNDFQRLLSGDIPPKYASLFQSGPLAIHHFTGSGTSGSGGEIYVAGRFPSLLVYDRRTFPKLKKTIHSGARLCSLASLPYRWESREERTARRSLDSYSSSEVDKSLPGKTLVACGEYNGKGSLEMYGVYDDSKETNIPFHQDSKFQNRVSASRTKLLSVVTQGARLVVSDGDGQIRWMERDGSSLVRSWNINNLEEKTYVPNLFNFEAGSGDVALKLLPTNNGWDDYRLGQEDLLVWTGERIGMVSFKPKRLSKEEEWEDGLSEEEMREKSEYDRYGHAMRRELERQADEARFMQRLGVGMMGP